MKYQKLIYTFMMATAFAACSQDVNEAAGLDPDLEGTYVEGVSDVEIRLASGNSATRAIINNLVNGEDTTDYFQADGLGIFMLATNKTGVNPIAPEINSWANASGKVYEGSRYVWLDNIQANATGVKDGSDQWVGTTIDWADGTTRFYPFNNWYAYKFFGYYPYSSNIEASADSRVVNFTNLDGETDIIWGESLGSDASSETNILRYCAKYFRKNDAVTPVLSFHHMLMGLQFQIYGLPDKEGGSDYTNAKKMSISKIQIVDVPRTAKLTVASRTQTFSKISDRFEVDWTNNLIDLLEVKPITGEAEFEKQIDQTEPQKLINVGNPVLVPVPVNSGTYYINIELKVDKGGGEYQTLTADPIMINHTTYEPGKVYNVKIGIAGPQEIKVNATLDKWVPETIEDGMELN